ncbi:hypothetical protein [Massilia brevitalea]|nr:hypothetical protein [Massilia brevitalea]
MIAALLSVLAVLGLGWILYINANDRRKFERQLEQYLADDTEA